MVELYGNQVLKNTLLLPQHMIYKKNTRQYPLPLYLWVATALLNIDWLFIIQILNNFNNYRRNY